ncbi:MAG: glycoside hydrolase family 3 protein [Alphaproteobacteria bacterium]|nr:glycoside hydrolase family 3 protein [Alphaproteobacteria bacterium]
MKKRNLFEIVIILACLIGVGVYHFTRPDLDEMVGQMIMTGFHGDGENQNPEEFATVLNQIEQGKIGGVILFDVDVSGLLAQGYDIVEAKKQIFSSNIKNVTQVKKLTTTLQSAAPRKLLIAIDQEGGNIQRLKPEHGFAPIPSAVEMAKTTPEQTYHVAYDLGNRLADLGINVDFAPLLDVNVNPDSPAIGAKERSFSENPDVVTKFAGAFANGLADAKIAYSYKHFPGHGSAGADTHAGLTDVTKTYQEYELSPWRDLLKDASPYTMVMVAHIVNQNIDTLPASLSKKTIQMIRDMGFNGVVVSDDMDMGAIANEYGIETAIQMAIDAGNDILVFGNNLTFDKNRGSDVNATIVKMVNEGKISKSRIRESYRRIMKMKQKLR